MNNHEIWKPVPLDIYYYGINSNYEASNWGRVRNVKTNRILHQSPSNGNWNRPRVQFSGPYNRRLSFLVSHVIYTTFIGDCYGKKVKHRDGNPMNNMLDNLYV